LDLGVGVVVEEVKGEVEGEGDTSEEQEPSGSEVPSSPPSSVEEHFEADASHPVPIPKPEKSWSSWRNNTIGRASLSTSTPPPSTLSSTSLWKRLTRMESTGHMKELLEKDKDLMAEKEKEGKRKSAMGNLLARGAG
jgi:hypothetical protein